MNATNNILERYGSTEVNSLTHVIGNNIEIDIFNTNQILSVKTSPYMNDEKCISFCGKHQNNFSILSLNMLNSMNLNYWLRRYEIMDVN